MGIIGNYHDKEQDELQTSKTRGQKRTLEQKERIRQKTIEAQARPEVREKMRNAKLGKTLSGEHKRKISEGMKRYREKQRVRDDKGEVSYD